MSGQGGGDESIFIPFYDAERLEKEGDTKEAFNRYTQFILDVKNFFENLEESYFKKEVREKVAKSYNSRGLIRYKKVDFPGAIEDYTRALEHHKDMYPAYYNRGLIHYRLGHYDEAISDCEAALRIFPSFEPAQHCLDQARTDKENKMDREKEDDEKDIDESQTTFNTDNESHENGEVR